jgi:hypothetical protein
MGVKIVTLLPLLIVIIASLYFLEKYSIKHAFDGVDYDINPDRNMAEIDEEFILETTIKDIVKLRNLYIKARYSEHDFKSKESKEAGELVKNL